MPRAILGPLCNFWRLSMTTSTCASICMTHQQNPSRKYVSYKETKLQAAISGTDRHEIDLVTSVFKNNKIK